jgi:nucleoid-associated protein YgaU
MPPTEQSNATGTDQLTVRTGDSLWMIAAHRLGPGASAARIATEWPRWYAANKALIGADPDLIRPGSRLHPPAGRTATTEE